MDTDANVPENVVADIEHGGITYYVCREDDLLAEAIDQGGLGPLEEVGPAHPETHGTYVLYGAKPERAFYSLNSETIVQDFEFNHADDAWGEGSLASLRIKAHLGTKFGAAATEDGSIYVFFQDASQQIVAARRDQGGKWGRVSGLQQSRAPGGASIFALAMKDRVHVFYAHEDGSIHDIALRNGVWEDSQVPLTDSEDLKTNIRAAPSEGDDYGLEYTNGEGEVYILDNGEKVLQGKHTEDGFQKKDEAEGWNPRGCQLFVRPRRGWGWR